MHRVAGTPIGPKLTLDIGYLGDPDILDSNIRFRAAAAIPPTWHR